MFKSVRAIMPQSHTENHFARTTYVISKLNNAKYKQYFATILSAGY